MKYILSIKYKIYWGDFVQRDFVLGGFCPRGDFVQGILSGGFCPGGFCPGEFCPDTSQMKSFLLVIVAHLLPLIVFDLSGIAQ